MECCSLNRLSQLSLFSPFVSSSSPYHLSLYPREMTYLREMSVCVYVCLHENENEFYMSISD